VSMATAPVAETRSNRARGAVLTVNLQAVAVNTRFFAARTRAEVMAVVKADGFGHGGRGVTLVREPAQLPGALAAALALDDRRYPGCLLPPACPTQSCSTCWSVTPRPVRPL
jgi:hypothetical protein